MLCIVSDLILEFEASPTKDLKHYKLYYEKTPNPVTYYSNSIILGKKNRVVLNEIEEMLVLEEGTYNLGVVAVNLANHESCMSRHSNFPIIFDPPASTGELLFMRMLRLL